MYTFTKLHIGASPLCIRIPKSNIPMINIDREQRRAGVDGGKNLSQFICETIYHSHVDAEGWGGEGQQASP